MTNKLEEIYEQLNSFVEKEEGKQTACPLGRPRVNRERAPTYYALIF